MYATTILLLCLFSLGYSDNVFDNVNCGYVQSDSWLATAPWLAAIKAVDLATDRYYTRCAGALINEKYVVTTASCLLPEAGTNIFGVQLDVTYVKTFQLGARLSTTTMKTFYGFEDKVIHPNYDARSGKNNVALMRLNRLVKYSRFLQPICLPFRDTSQTGTFYTGTWAEMELLFASLPTQKSNIVSSWASNVHNNILTVEWENNTEKLCNGYVGAPLTYMRNNQYFLQGLLIESVDCNKKQPGVYLNIFDYLDWIKATATSNYNQCTTPDNQKSICIPLDSCPTMLKAFANPKKTDETYLRQYICSDDQVGGYQVCCPASLNATFLDNPPDESLNKLSDKRFCGYQHRDDYISRQEEIAIDEFPWLATIRAIRQGNEEYSICSGSLINNRYVLTSAYCLRSFLQITTIRLGEYNVLNKTDCVDVTELNEKDCTESKDFGIEKVIMHPFYSFWTYHNDIALIKLDKIVEYSDYIRPICLPIPKFKTVQLNDNVYTTSFTAPKPWGTHSLKKKLLYSVVENQKCQHKQTVNEYNLCLEAKSQKIDTFFTCYDDDGAPAMHSQKGQWILNGITTERVSYCDVSQPIILTKIASYLRWIQENVKN